MLEHAPNARVDSPVNCARNPCVTWVFTFLFPAVRLHPSAGSWLQDAHLGLPKKNGPLSPTPQWRTWSSNSRFSFFSAWLHRRLFTWRRSQGSHVAYFVRTVGFEKIAGQLISFFFFFFPLFLERIEEDDLLFVEINFCEKNSNRKRNRSKRSTKAMRQRGNETQKEIRSVIRLNDVGDTTSLQADRARGSAASVSLRHRAACSSLGAAAGFHPRISA